VIDETDIMRLAGKNAKAIWAIDFQQWGDDIEFSVWLKDGYIQRNYNNTIIVFDDSEDPDTVEYLFSLVEKEVA